MRSAWYSMEFSRGGIEQADLRSIIGIFSAWILKLILSWVMVPVMTLWKLEVRAHSSCSPWRLFTIFIPLANCKVSWLIAIGWKLRVENSVAEFQHQMPGGSIRPKYRIPLLSIASAADWFGRSSGKLCKYIVIILNLNYYNWLTLVENNKKLMIYHYRDNFLVLQLFMFHHIHMHDPNWHRNCPHLDLNR